MCAKSEGEMGEQSFIVFFIPSRHSRKAKEAPNVQRMSLVKKLEVNFKKEKDNFSVVHIVKIDNVMNAVTYYYYY